MIQIHDRLRRIGSECLMIFSLACLLSAAALAQQKPGTFHVIKVDRKGLGGAVLDLGSAAGAKTGDEVQVFRVVQIRHPVTKKRIQDRVPIGELVLKQVGEHLSVASGAKELMNRIKAGDQVELSGAEAGPTGQRRPAPPPRGPAAGPALEPDTAAVLEAWKRSLGKSPAQRIEIWEEFKREHPRSSYAMHLAVEIRAMKSLAEKLRAPRPQVTKPPRAEQRLEFGHRGKSSLYTGEPLQVAVKVNELDPIRSADVYYHRVGEATYEKLPMNRDGDVYLRAEISAGQVVSPGVVYFIEVVDEQGGVHHPVGDQKTPYRVNVADPPGSIRIDRSDRSQISMLCDYVDFKLDKGEDYFWMVETDFLYRVMTILYSVRVGFGVLRGEGAKVEVVQSGQPSDPVGFNYGYTELEFRFHEYFSVITRGILGLNRPPDEPTGELAAGIEGKIRIGRELGTNLVMGGAFLQDVGAMGLLELSWDVIEYFPMGGRVEVTNQPVGEDIGVRIVYQIGLKAVDWFQPTLRLGLALRRIDHLGMSAGLGTVFRW